jgi:hypothetical protein
LKFVGHEVEGAIVETLSETFTEVWLVAFNVTEDALKLQLLSDGKPEHMEGARLIVPVNPLCAINVSMVDPEPPG